VDVSGRKMVQTFGAEREAMAGCPLNTPLAA